LLFCGFVFSFIAIPHFADTLTEAGDIACFFCFILSILLTAPAHLQSCWRLHLLLSLLSSFSGDQYASQQCNKFRLAFDGISLHFDPFFLASHSSLQATPLLLPEENQTNCPAFLQSSFHLKRIIPTSQTLSSLGRLYPELYPTDFLSFLRFPALDY
jgi:hypothetical protein